MAAMATPGERERVDAAAADAAQRLRGKVMAGLSCKEAEWLLDGNFRANDEVCSSLRLAWDCAVRLEAQLGEADRPWEQRNRWLQDLSAERGLLEQQKQDLEAVLLTAKLQVQTACASATGFQASRFAEVLEANVAFRQRCDELGNQLEAVVHSARRSLRLLGERPDVRPESEAAGTARRWRLEFDAASDVAEAMLRSLRHPEAASGVASSSLEHALDQTWRFLLELVGLFERLDAEAAEAEADTLRERLEAVLPQLLECKLQVQDSAAKQQPLEVQSCMEALTQARSCQQMAWKYLTSNSIDLSHVVPTKFAEEMLPHPAAFGPAAGPLGEGEDFPPVLRLLTYNLFLRAPAPQFTHNNEDDRKDERLCRFVEHLARYDLICLQEVFGAFSQRRDWLINVAKRFGLKDSHRSSTSVRPRFIVDGGLLILSRLPIVFKSSLTFEPGMHLDRFSAKGALYAKVQCGPTGPFLHVCTTHLQSTYSEDAAASAQTVRHKQLQSLVEFLQEQTNDHISDSGQFCRRWPLLLCGTLNFNGRKGLMDGGHSAEYRAVLQLFKERLGEVRDLLYDVTGCHPVTYADTRLTGQGEVPVERVLTNASVYNSNSLKRQCLDYMLFFPYVSPLDGENGHEPVVPATCQIQKFSVDRSKDVGAPVTQLSDHYGLEGSLAIIESPAYLSAQRPEQRSRGTDVLGQRPADGYGNTDTSPLAAEALQREDGLAEESMAELPVVEAEAKPLPTDSREPADTAADVVKLDVDCDASPADLADLALG